MSFAAKLDAITSPLIDELLHHSVRAQGQSYDRKLAHYLGIDFDELHAADWDAAITENEEREGVFRLTFDDVAAGEVAPHVPTSIGGEEA